MLHATMQEDRSAVENRTIKALYTKLLFILTRCSRLLITEQLNLFATEPRNHRYPVFNGQRGMVMAPSAPYNYSYSVFHG